MSPEPVHCPNCGYSLHGLAQDSQCPECGWKRYWVTRRRHWIELLNWLHGILIFAIVALIPYQVLICSGGTWSAWTSGFAGSAMRGSFSDGLAIDTYFREIWNFITILQCIQGCALVVMVVCLFIPSSTAEKVISILSVLAISIFVAATSFRCFMQPFGHTTDIAITVCSSAILLSARRLAKWEQITATTKGQGAVE